MKEASNVIRLSVCPKCRRIYSEPPALPRADGQTHICPDCGTREALESIGVNEQEQDAILETIHRSMGRI